MEIEKCPDCNGSGFATNRKFRTIIQHNGMQKKKCLLFYIDQKTKKEILSWEANESKCMTCQYCKGKGYLYDRLPYDGPLDIGFRNF